MARLPEEQAAANDEASRERTRAYNARRSAYQAELAAVKTSANLSPEQIQLDAVRTMLDAALEERNRELAAIDEQILRLRGQRAEVDAQHAVVLDGLKQRRNAAWTARVGLGNKLKKKVDARYPDMVDCARVCEWQRPEGV